MYNYIFRCIYKLHVPRSLNHSHGILLKKKNDLTGRKFLTLSIWEKVWHGLTLPPQKHNSNTVHDIEGVPY